MMAQLMTEVENVKNSLYTMCTGSDREEAGVRDVGWTRRGTWVSSVLY
jgi:hypothetical protein